MRTPEIFADAIRLIRNSGHDLSLAADFGMCGHLLYMSETRKPLLQKYTASELKKAAAHAQHFVDTLNSCLVTETLMEELLNRNHEPESAVERWFLIYEDWENRYDYI